MSMKKLRKKSYKMIIIIYDRKTTPTSDRNLVNKISSDKPPFTRVYAKNNTPSKVFDILFTEVLRREYRC